MTQLMLNCGRNGISDDGAKNLFIDAQQKVETAIFVAVGKGIAATFLDIAGLAKASTMIKTALTEEKKKWNQVAKTTGHQEVKAGEKLNQMLNVLNTRHHMQMAHLKGTSITGHHYTKAEPAIEIYFLRSGPETME